MTIVCPRCATANSRWKKRCRACWLELDASLRASRRSTQTTSASNAGEVGSDAARSAAADSEAERSVREREKAGRTAAEDARHKPLADLLGLEDEHVSALADAGIHTLEHIAGSLPHQIAHALQEWTHIDAGALIARAQQLLRREKPKPEPPPTNASQAEPQENETRAERPRNASQAEPQENETRAERPRNETRAEPPENEAPVEEPDPAQWWKMT